ncbi:putative LRR receptor serine/threonine-protein kinase [Trifolium repens]|nr:putative LRR receptor serine/threonine-protein kinase [Trifolium repens]
MPRRLLQPQETPPSSSSSSAPHHRSEALFFFLGGIVVLIILLIIIFVCWKRIKRAPAELPEKTASPPNQTQKHEDEMMKKIVPTDQQSGFMEFISGNLRTISYFDFQTLRKATKNFHRRNLLGSGGFGPVYQGKLVDGRVVAYGPQRILVYEYMKNKSLDLFIHGKSDELYLNWSTRFQIILGVARGLQYLHEDSHVRIVHRDIKASNILLDEKFQPRIGDFGLARFFPEDQAYLSTQFAGTLGYTAPEYAIRGELSEKADIYSFGVLVLEVISCRKNTDLTLPSDMQYLPEYAWKLYEKSMVMDLIDPKLREKGYVEKDVMQAFHVAFLCLQPHPDLRPAMSQIVAMLTFKIDMVTTPMRPAFLDRRRVMDDENHSWEVISEVLQTPVASDSML